MKLQSRHGEPKDQNKDVPNEERASFEIANLPHYSPHCPIYNLLLSALSLSSHYETLPGTDERQIKLENLMKKYQKAFDAANGELC